MPNIEHVVVLMLENRSFDSMLGWLYQSGAPSQFLPAGSPTTYDGLQAINPGDFINTAQNGAISVAPIQGAQGFTVPTVDPGEEYEHVAQQFYNSPTWPPVPPPNMQGYVQDFVDVMTNMGIAAADIPALAPQVMQGYTPQQLPVLNQLAQAYAVSDAWYASVPSQTNPNRAFLMCGTSLGLLNNGQLETNAQAQEIEQLLGMAIGDDVFDTPAIFNALDTAGVSWGVFWQTSYLPEKIYTLLTYGKALAAAIAIIYPPASIAILAALLALGPYVDYLESLTDGSLGSCYTWRLFPQIQAIENAAQNFQSLDQFHALAQAGNLPAFTYIEPFWSISQVTTPSLSSLPKALVTCLGNDYHPPSNLLVGEELVKAVYTSLVSNPAAWQNTVLLITFDEFVGSFDHEINGLQPKLVNPPWGQGTAPQLAQTNSYNFDSLGARVPTLVVSPWVQAGTVFRSPTNTPFDHTSMIATALNLLGAGNQVAQFGARTAAAPTFDIALTLATPRTDAYDLPFMDRVNTTGDPVNYGDSFVLVNQNGASVTASVAAVKAVIPGLPSGAMGMAIDLGLAAYFPTLTENNPVPLSFVTQAPNVSGQIPDQAQGFLLTRENAVGAANALGQWSDSWDVYYFAPYLDTDADYANQQWLIQNRTNPGAGLCYGDQVVLLNVYGAEQQGLAADGHPFMGAWITSSNSPDLWTVQPAPVVLPG